MSATAWDSASALLREARLAFREGRTKDAAKLARQAAELMTRNRQ